MAKFKPGDSVINILTSERGVICEVCPPGRGRQLYRVNFGVNIATQLEQNLDLLFDDKNPFERVKKGIFGNRDQFVLVNTTYKINNSNNNTISSLKASKTLFKAYQFKPLLKFLNSNSRRVLIADEVGLGKTIEAGHILLELKAREEFKSALIVCPNSLKIKWQTELMEKFGLNFKIYESLNDAIEDLKVHPQNARGILNYEKIRAKKIQDVNGKNNHKIKPNALGEFLESGMRRYSIVLCDEAHKLRNHTTLQNQGMEPILEHSDSVVFLTATPIMLGENDLFNLLHLLEPETYDNSEVFRNQINANRPFVKAISLLNANKSFADIKKVLIEEPIEKIVNIGDFSDLTTTSVEEEYRNIPLYDKIIDLLSSKDNLSVRVQLQNDIVALSSINDIFSRTRKREISEEEKQQSERRAHKVVVSLSNAERMLYDEVINDYMETVREKSGYYSYGYGEENVPWGCILGLIQKKRMVASSVNGYRIFCDNVHDENCFCQEVDEQSSLPDAKIECLERIFKGIKNVGSNKVIIFSIFKFTIKYLEIRLKKMGYNVFAIHGDIKERESIISKFKMCEDFSILLSTEVGSEGLDMQFCSHLVNFDLPWNPMVVEQRIGRIDRFGQQSAQVHIYNLVVKDSIQEKIYDRLLNRIGIFQGVIGDLEMILEEMDATFKHLESDLYGTKLSKEAQEKKIRDIEKAIENNKIQLEQVEEGMTNALSNDIYFQNEISKIKNHKLYVTETELINYVKMLVSEKLKNCTFKQISDNEYLFSVPKSKPKVLVDFITSYQLLTSDFEDLFRVYRRQLLDDFENSNQRIITFDQKYAFENKSIDFVNIYNPIIVASSLFFKDSIESIGSTFQLKYKLSNGIDFDRGLFYLAIYIITINKSIMGKQVPSDILVPVWYNVASDRIIENPDLNMLLFGEIQDNSEFLSELDTDILTSETCANMESDFTAYISDFVSSKKQEIIIKDESQKQLRLRRIEEYYTPRIEKEIQRLESYREQLNDSNTSAINNRIRLTENRIKMLNDSKSLHIERVNSIQPPTMSYKLISLTKVLIY